jgi:hypothetical protein
MAARKILAAINFTQRYEKLRPYDVHMRGEVTGKTKKDNNLFISNEHFTILHHQPSVSHFCQIFIMGYNDEGMTELVP